MQQPRLCPVLALAALASAWPVRAQFCPIVTYPYRTMVRPTADFRTVFDGGLGVGKHRMIATSNSCVRIHCKTGGPLNAQAPMAGASDAEINSALFVPTTDNGNFQTYQIVDPRIIYDDHAKRYWIVACEQDRTNVFQARLHIAVSVDDTPDSWSTDHWHKYTGDANDGGAGSSLNPAAAPFQPDVFEPGFQPDRPSIRVDDQFLYISVREAFEGFTNDRTFMIVLDKAPLMDGDPFTVETSKFIDADGGTTQTVMHELAVDDDIQAGQTPCVYMMALPDHNNPAIGTGAGKQFTTVRLGAFWYDEDEVEEENRWKYDKYPIDLTPAPSRAFEGVGLLGAPGGSGDENALQWSLFWSVQTRRVSGERRVWAVHHVRPANASDDAPTQLQWYQIRVNNWPFSGFPTLDRKERLSLNNVQGVQVYIHDSGIAANECGQVVLGFTRAAFLSGGNWTYPQFWRAFYDSIPGNPPSVAMVAAGASQYYDPSTGNPIPAWADFARVAADPYNSTRYYAHHMTVYDDGVFGLKSLQWESWIAQFVLTDCAPALMDADYDKDSDIDLADLEAFEAFAKEKQAPADLDKDGKIDDDDLALILKEVGQQP